MLTKAKFFYRRFLSHDVRTDGHYKQTECSKRSNDLTFEVVKRSKLKFETQTKVLNN